MQIHLLSVVKIIWAKFDFFYRPSPRACHSHPCTITSFRRNLGGRSEAARVDIWHLRQQFIYVCVLMCWCTCICYLMSAVCGHASSTTTTHKHTHVYNYKSTLPPPLLFKMYKRLRAVEESTDLPTKIIYTQFKMYLKILVHPHPVYLFSTTSSFCSENLFRLCAFIAIQWKNCNEKVAIKQS